MKNAMITVKVTEEQLKAFNAYAKAQDRPLAQIVREALTARISRAEKTQPRREVSDEQSYAKAPVLRDKLNELIYATAPDETNYFKSK
jgi:hypothetical protein